MNSLLRYLIALRLSLSLITSKKPLPGTKVKFWDALPSPLESQKYAYQTYY